MLNKLPENFDDFTALVEAELQAQRSHRKSAEPMDYIRALHKILNNLMFTVDDLMEKQ